MKRKIKQKAAAGLNKVVVPAQGDMGQVASSALSMASTGMALGGPIGAGVGAVVGGAMGLLQKRKMDKENQKAKKYNQYITASNGYAAEDATSMQGMQQYAEGTEGAEQTKPIEVEKDELIFRKVGSRFKLKKDFKGGKTHAQGGEDYVAAEGDIIFPGKLRTKVLTKLQNGDHKGLESMRMKLPADTNPQGQAAKGLRGGELPYVYENNTSITSPYSFNFLRPGEVMGGLTPDQQASGFGQETSPLYTALPDWGAQDVSSPEVTSISEGVKEKGKGFDGSNLLQYASVANNLIQGLSPAQKVEENYVNAQQLSYTDRSQPLRNQALQIRNKKAASARNSSGGNMQVQRALEAAADSERMNQLGTIDAQEQARASEVRSTNAQLSQQADMLNAQKRDQYAALNAQAQANKQQYMDAAMGQLSSLGTVRQQEKYMRSRDAKADAVDQQRLNLTNQLYQFGYNPDGTISFNGGVAPYLPKQGSMQQQSEQYDGLGRKKKTVVTRRKSGI